MCRASIGSRVDGVAHAVARMTDYIYTIVEDASSGCVKKGGGDPNADTGVWDRAS